MLAFSDQESETERQLRARIRHLEEQIEKAHTVLNREKVRELQDRTTWRMSLAGRIKLLAKRQPR